MKKDGLRKRMRRDCFRHMKYAVIVRFFTDFSGLALPTITASMIGDMADHLLALDRARIFQSMPPFLLALGINLIAVPLLQLAENLLLTREGLAYDRYLMQRYLHLPIIQAKQYGGSTIVSRLEEDSVDYYFHLIHIWTRPFVIALYGIGIGYMMIRQHYPALFAGLLLCTAGLPVLRANLVGKRAARLNAQLQQYNEEKRAQEHMLFSARDFFRSYGIASFPLDQADLLFHQYMEKSGKEKIRLDVWEQILDVLCNYGIQMVTVVAGALLMAFGQMTGGTLLAAFLVLPIITQCCHFAAEWVKAIRAEPELQDRLALFYGIQEPDYPSTAVTTQQLRVENASFSYSPAEKPVFHPLNLRIRENDRLWIRGRNGCGKSTLLLLLCGLYPLDRGEICSADPLSVAELRRLTAIQEQDGALFSGTIEENLFAPDVPGRQKARLLTEFGLKKPLDFPVQAQGQNLSPGERKKILLARALLKDASYLFLDEPLNHLDDQGKRALGEILEGRRGAVVFTSHIPILNEQCCTFDMPVAENPTSPANP